MIIRLNSFEQKNNNTLESNWTPTLMYSMFMYLICKRGGGVAITLW